jgi:hypothetical protein
LEEGRILF